MYNNPRRRGGTQGVAGVRVRQVPVDAHAGTYRDYLRRHERETYQAVQDDSLRRRVVDQLFERTADPRNLMCAWEHLASGEGQTPGIDGMSYRDLEPFEVWQLLRTVSRSIHTDTYRVAPDLIRKIPKSSGQGVRTLNIPTVVDRVVQRAVVQITQPILDPEFDERSHGYRPGKDRQLSLAMADKLAMTGDRWVWVTEDIQNAFDHVPQGRLLDVVYAELPNDPFIKLIGRIVRTASRRGLRQGGSLSPLLLNVYLDHLLDRKWRNQHATVPLIRVADDLLLLCRTEEEAVYEREELAQLLQAAGLPLKGSRDTAVRNLYRGQEAHWLGYQLVRDDNHLVTHIGIGAWKSLATGLETSHRHADAPSRGVETIRGWLAQQGPCFPSLDFHATYARIADLALTYGHEEIPSKEELYEDWERAHARYFQIQQVIGRNA